MAFLAPLAPLLGSLFSLPEVLAPAIGGALDTIGVPATLAGIGGEFLSPVALGAGLGGAFGGTKGLEEGALAGLGSGFGSVLSPILGGAVGDALGGSTAGTVLGQAIGSVGGDVLGSTISQGVLGKGNTPPAAPQNTLAPSKGGGGPSGPSTAGASGLSLSGSTAPNLYPWVGSSFGGIA